MRNKKPVIRDHWCIAKINGRYYRSSTFRSRGDAVRYALSCREVVGIVCDAKFKKGNLVWKAPGELLIEVDGGSVNVDGDGYSISVASEFIDFSTRTPRVKNRCGICDEPIFNRPSRYALFTGRICSECEGQFKRSKIEPLTPETYRTFLRMERAGKFAGQLRFFNQDGEPSEPLPRNENGKVKRLKVAG